MLDALEYVVHYAYVLAQTAMYSGIAYLAFRLGASL